MIPVSLESCAAAAREVGWDELAAQLEAGGIQEADFRPSLHPRDRLGKFAGSGRVHTVGLTPFREDVERDTGARYYGTHRFAQFEQDLATVAREEHVRVHQIEHTRGVWAGGGEPSAQVVLVNGEGVKRVADRLANPYMQKATIGFKRNAGGESRQYRTREKFTRAQLEKAMEGSDLPGATLRQDGTVEIIDIGQENPAAAEALLKRLGATARFRPGDAELRFAGEDYPDGVKKLIPIHPDHGPPPSGPLK